MLPSGQCAVLWGFRDPGFHELVAKDMQSQRSVPYQFLTADSLALKGWCPEKRRRVSIGLLLPTVPMAGGQFWIPEGKRTPTWQRSICAYCSQALHSFLLLFDSLQESHYELISSLQGASWWKTLLKLCFSVLNLFKADCWEVIIISVIKSGNNANNNNFFFIEHSNHKHFLNKCDGCHALAWALWEFQRSSLLCPCLKKCAAYLETQWTFN